VDLLCWMIKGYDVLSRLAKHMGNTKAADHYAGVKASLMVSSIV
jgi:hypothetical protein